MISISSDTRIHALERVIRVFNARSSGDTIHYSSVLRSHELIYKLSGDSISRINGASFRLSQGALLYLPKGSWREYSVETLQQGESIDIMLDLNMPLSAAPLLLSAPHLPAMKKLFINCHDAWRMGEETRMLSCMGHAYGILALMKEESAREHLSETKQRVVDLSLQYLSAHLVDHDLDLRKMVSEVGVSYSYMKQLFIRQMKTPPSRYVTLRRIEMAKDLLQATEMSITQIADAVGYGNIYYFSRVFHQEAGCSPSAYRQQMR